ncbi:transcriptional regulator, IclR family protein [Pseudonocardia sp. MH-G8]|nr:transcriptional regulator, IclR family protein [Pseudonocardia sp. MH-G8]
MDAKGAVLADDGERGERARSGVQSIDRAVAVLRCFDARRPELGISEIARLTGLSTSTTYRLLTAMQANHLVRPAPGKRYALGPLLVQLARSGAIPTTLRDAALPLMTALRDEVDETIGLHEALPTGERIVVDQVESRQELRRTYTDIGVPLPLPHAAPGRAILSVLPLRRQDELLSRPIRPVTPLTITDADVLRTHLARARARGWTVSRSERSPGICAVAAPIFDHAAHAVGALSASVPESRIDAARVEELGTRIKDVAWQISETLGATAAAVQITVEAAGPAVE